jgi:protein phosphatase
LRRLRRLTPALLIATCVLAILAAGAYVASTAVYFVATNDRGFVTIYSGLPYSLPGGIHLYSQYYVSGVPASTIPTARRKSLLDHQLRSQDDASGLVRQLERGQISGASGPAPR